MKENWSLFSLGVRIWDFCSELEQDIDPEPAPDPDPELEPPIFYPEIGYLYVGRFWILFFSHFWNGLLFLKIISYPELKSMFLMNSKFDSLIFLIEISLPESLFSSSNLNELLPSLCLLLILPSILDIESGFILLDDYGSIKSASIWLSTS